MIDQDKAGFADATADIVVALYSETHGICFQNRLLASCLNLIA